MNTKDQMLENLINEISSKTLSFKDLISIDNVNQEDLESIIYLAWKASEVLKWDEKKVPILKWKTIINFFMENSTRTRTSFELAWKNLWADVINMSSDSSSMSKWETLLDTSITLDQMQANLITVRSPNAWVPKFVSKNIKSSVINAWDWWNEHPTQALLDLLTMRQNFWKDLKWRKMLIVWDTIHSRVFGSLARISQKVWLDTTVSCPHTLVQPFIDQWWIKYESNLEKALKWVDIIYVLRLQTERAASNFVPTLREYSKTYVINAKRLKLANKNAIVMHPWPVIREFDIHTNILEHTASLVPQQVFNGYCMRFVLLSILWNNNRNKKIEKRLY